MFLVGARHPEHVDFPFPEGSVVIDQWRFVPARDGITVIPVGGQGGARVADPDEAPSNGDVRLAHAGQQLGRA